LLLRLIELWIQRRSWVNMGGGSSSLLEDDDERNIRYHQQCVSSERRKVSAACEGVFPYVIDEVPSLSKRIPSHFPTL
jgi:hypothetical protein